MNPRMKSTLHLAFITGMAFLLNACSSTNLTKNWSDSNYQGPALKKILIIGVIKDDAKRHLFEDKFARLMSTSERTGIASYRFLPNLEKTDNKEKVLAAVEKTAADAVMVVTTHGLINLERSTAPSFDYLPGTSASYGMYGYYNVSHTLIFNQGYTVSDSLLNIDVKLFDVASEKIIWAGKTQSYNPSSAKQVITEFEKLVMRDMQQNGLIK